MLRLAAPTPLYAPLYLAKQERLTDAFDWVDFHYLPVLDNTNLYDGLVTKDGKPGDVVLTIGNPLRLPDAGDYRFVGGLIRKMNFWVCTNTSDSIPGAADIHKIFTPRTGSTGHTWASYFFKSEKVDPKDKILAECLLGDPERWYKHYQNRLPGQRLAFVTSDISVTDNPEFQILDKAYDKNADILLTGIATSEVNWKAREGLICELLLGIQMGVDRILNHPNWSARQLSHYAKREPLIKRYFGAEDNSFRILEALKKGDCYNTKPGFKIQETWVDAAFQIEVGAGNSDIEKRTEKTKKACANILCPVAPPTTLRPDGRDDAKTAPRGGVLVLRSNSKRWNWKIDLLVPLVAVGLTIAAHWWIAPHRANCKFVSIEYFPLVMVFWTISGFFGILVSEPVVDVVRQKIGVPAWRIIPAFVTMICVVWASSRVALREADSATSVLFNYLGFAGLALLYIAPGMRKRIKHWMTTQLLNFRIGRIIRDDYQIYQLRAEIAALEKTAPALDTGRSGLQQNAYIAGLKSQLNKLDQRNKERYIQILNSEVVV